VEKPIPAYSGDAPYVFVSYAHDDSAVVYPEIQWLHDQGFNLWYDEGLRPGSEWHSELAEAIENCSLCLFFVSPRSVDSAHCQREVHYAIDQKRQTLAIYLEPSELPSGLKFALSTIQATMRHELSEAQYRAKLLEGVTNFVQRGIAETADVQSKPVKRPRRLLGALATIVFVGVAGAFAYLGLTGSGVEATDGNERNNPVVAMRPNWVAILPFRAVSTSPEAEQLAEGITGDLINAFSGLGMFSVASHGTVRSYAGSAKSSREISAELEVRYLIEGRVQASGDQTRIGIALVDGFDGRTLWQENKSYRNRNPLDVQDDVARFVSRALDVELVRLETERVRNLSTEDMQAWDLYVSAMAVWEGALNPTSIDEAIAKHRRALELDPDYAPSLGQLATLLVNVTQFGGARDREAVQSEACQLADRVARSGQESSYALFSAVHVLTQFCGQAERAALIARRIVDAYPNSGYNRTQLGNALLHAGQLDEALEVMENAEREFADNVYVFRYTPFWKSMVFTEREDWESVLAVSGASLGLNPDNFFEAFLVANALGVLGRQEEAKAVWAGILEKFPEITLANYEWFMTQGLVKDERVERFVRGLKRARVEDREA
jgi:TolB-like protein